MEISRSTLNVQHMAASASQTDPCALTVPLAAAKPRSGLLDVTRSLLLGLLMAAPLCFGAVQPWAWAGLTIIACVLLLLWALACISTGTIVVTSSPLYTLLLGLLLLAWAQLRFGLSMDYVGTREALIKLIGYAIIFFTTQQLFSSAIPKTWQYTGTAITIYIFLMALFAIVQFFASPGLVYGVVPGDSASVFGPYVNRGNYAGLMEMLIPVAVTFACSLRWRHPAKIFIVFVIFTALVSVLLSGSRAGLISLAVEFAIIGTAIMFAGAEHKHVLLAGILVAGLAVGAFYWLDPGDVWGRWKQMASTPELAFGNRQKMARDAVRMGRDHLLHGVGLGAFEVAYTPYQTVVTDLTIDYAHNDYLQFFAEAGILACILAPASIGVFLLLAFRRLPARLRQQSGWLQFGAAVGVCGLLVHSFTEFNLHIPANAIWFTFLVAIATLPRTRSAGA
jgi:O-antigen ligase